MIHINTVPLTKDGNHIDYWCKFELVNEKVECIFINNGEVFAKVSNVIGYFGTLGTLNMIVSLVDNKNAEREAIRIIESANKSTHSLLNGLKILGGEYHV